jgi:hypothetical protein
VNVSPPSRTIDKPGQAMAREKSVCAYSIVVIPSDRRERTSCILKC